jgi:hypothetical protein
MAFGARLAVFGALLTAVPRAERTAPRTPIDVSKLGSQAGESVPDFSLSDENGKTWTLQSIMSKDDSIHIVSFSMISRTGISAQAAPRAGRGRS